MTNFSSFFPTAGGGGGIGKTITVGDYSYPNAISLESFEDTMTQLISPSHQNNFSLTTPSTSSPTSYSLTPSAHSTYANLANITSATNGGGIYFLGAVYQNSINYAPGFYWRITIDGGTPYEITTGTTISGESQVVLMGAGYEIYAAYTENQNRDSSSSFSQIKNAMSNATGAYNSFASGRYYTSQNNEYSLNDVTVLPAEIQCTLGLPYIYFSSSCLVEFKVNQNVTFASGQGKAIIKTF